MRFKAILYLLGRLVIVIGGCMLLPAGVSYYYGESETMSHFLFTALGAVLFGIFLMILFRATKDQGIGVRDGFLLVTVTWLVVSLVGCIPFFLSVHFPTFIDAFFEAVSGFTTTGASVLANIEALPHGLLFWRSFIQWIGGMGIVVLAVAILPQLSIGGIQLMKNEMPGPTFEQLKPRIKETALSLWKVYVFFSLCCAVALYLAGMSIFDAICHMFATMPVGGFSTKNASISHFNSPTIEMIIAAFMYLSGINFVLHYANLKGNVKKMLMDAEWRFYTTLVLVATVAIAINLTLQANYSLLQGLRYSVFQVVSLTTTGGFMTADFDQWPYLSRGILFLLLFVGGQAGSAAGGLKQVRLLLLFKRAKQSIVQHIFPKAIVSVKMNQRVIPENILHGISSFFLIYIVLFSFMVLPLLMYNIDFVTATSAVVACLSNVGPGFGLVGPTQNFAFMPDPIKLLLSAGMIIGRLEIYTVLVLFFPATWRR